MGFITQAIPVPARKIKGFRSSKGPRKMPQDIIDSVNLGNQLCPPCTWNYNAGKESHKYSPWTLLSISQHKSAWIENWNLWHSCPSFFSHSVWQVTFWSARLQSPWWNPTDALCSPRNFFWRTTHVLKQSGFLLSLQWHGQHSWPQRTSLAFEFFKSKNLE